MSKMVAQNRCGEGAGPASCAPTGTWSSGTKGLLRTSVPDDFFLLMEPRETSVMLWIWSGPESKGSNRRDEERSDTSVAETSPH